MKNKDILDINSIIKEYNNGVGVEKLALKYHVGKLKIKSLLNDNGIVIKKRGGQKKRKQIYHFRLENR